MTELTKEYFDKQLKNLATKQGLDSLDKKIDKLETELKLYIKEENEELARMVNTGLEDVIKRIDFRERVEELERKMIKMEKALNLRL